MNKTTPQKQWAQAPLQEKNMGIPTHPPRNPPLPPPLPPPPGKRLSNPQARCATGLPAPATRTRPEKNENDRYNSNSASSGTFQLPWSVCCKRGVLLRIGKTSVGLPEVQHLYFRLPLSPVVMRKIQGTDNLRRTTSWNPLCGLKCRFATLQGHKTVQVNVIPSKPG